MKQFCAFLLLVLLAVPAFAQYSDPNYPKPTTGYGADGPHPVGTVSFPNPNYLGHDIEVYYPSDATGRVPTIFYSHAYGGTQSANISGMLNFVAHKGYAIVFVPYPTVGVTVADRCTNLLQGFRRAARRYPAIIDTTRVGFLGHSFGGGASFANGLRCFTDNNWGQNGRFIYALAPWYVYNLTPAQLASFPADTRLLVEIFNDDTNDHRMAIDAFRNVNIPAAEKDFLLLRSDTLANHTYLADHVVPNTSAAFDALDYYAYYRLLDALCDYTFTSSLTGKNVALGHGSAAQVTMPTGLKPLISSSIPLVRWPQSKYLFPCSDVAQNPRIQFCPSIVSATLPGTSAPALTLFPNPAATSITISGAPAKQPVRVFNVLGSLVLTAPDASRPLAIAALPAGCYYLQVGSQRARFQRE